MDHTAGMLLTGDGATRLLRKTLDVPVHAGRFVTSALPFLPIRVLTLLSLLIGNVAAADIIEQGALAELSFTSATAHTNRFDVELQATLSNGSDRFTFWGFYAGSTGGVHTWKVRYNLPRTGAWQYATTSSDHQLNGKIGSVTVTPPSPDNRGVLIGRGRALIWENTGEPYFIMAQTAYGILHANIPWRQVLEWLQRHGFNQIRIDLIRGTRSEGQEDMWLWGGTPNHPEFSRFNLAQWDKMDEVLQEGRGRGFTVEVGPRTIQQFPKAGPDRRRYLRYLAARLGAYPHLIYMEDLDIYHTPVRHGIFPSQRTVKSVGSDFADAFQFYPRRPLFGIHMRRNDTYHQGSTASRYYHPGSTGLPADFRGQNWLTCGILHERWKMEGFGILQHRPHFAVPMYIGEAVYEDTDGTVSHQVMRELEVSGLQNEITNDPRFYYRRYAYSTVLSGGVGITYGLRGDSSYRNNQGQYLPRWATGIPPSQDQRNGADGFRDIKRALDYFRAKGLDVNRLEPDDTQINNGFSRFTRNVLSRRVGLKRAKFAKITGEHTYYAYNPYYTDLRIRGIPPGLDIEVFDPRTGKTYHGGQTSGGPVFSRPPGLEGDYLLFIAAHASAH